MKKYLFTSIFILLIGVMFVLSGVSPPDVDIYSETIKIESGPTTTIDYEFTADQLLISGLFSKPLKISCGSVIYEAGVGQTALFDLTNAKQYGLYFDLSNDMFAQTSGRVRQEISPDMDVYNDRYKIVNNASVIDTDTGRLRVSNDRSVIIVKTNDFKRMI